MAIIKRHLVIYGDVHGVFFRYNTRKIAKELGLKGFVRNIPEGVEVIVQGDEEKVKKLIEFCRKGPPGARVERIDLREENISNDFDDFNIRY